MYKKLIYTYGMTQDVPVLLKERNTAVWKEISGKCRKAVSYIAEHLPESADEDAIQQLLYDAPKKIMGIPLILLIILKPRHFRKMFTASCIFFFWGRNRVRNSQP
ncbi:hypothetical protein K7I13_14955 [Brucepastera parasyntrophica]|uniref:hypothetical protein n=1 Tax=Brucepastera parasyntrophica TaxID=2880008 RepID=UPI00210ECD51|nr:hypothetical protein [Brucepastera parasyntrophica]ULQ59730.1 hypothetical protein K7I13_14955 [Brucepastera parasyntrophica]